MTSGDDQVPNVENQSICAMYVGDNTPFTIKIDMILASPTCHCFN